MEVAERSCQCQFSVASGDALGFAWWKSGGSFLSSGLLVQITPALKERCQRALKSARTGKPTRVDSSSMVLVLDPLSKYPAGLAASRAGPRLPLPSRFQSAAVIEDEHDYDFGVSQEAQRRGPFLPGAR